MEAISVKNLSVAYENNTIIEDMSLSIPKGKISIIIGANGCGKSTLLKTIARINKPKSGDIFINNKNIKKVKEKNIAKEVAFLPQGPVCPDGLTVRERAKCNEASFSFSFSKASRKSGYFAPSAGYIPQYTMGLTFL